MVWSWKKILVSVGCSCTLFMLTTLVSSDQNIFAKMEAITMDFRSFHRIYHEKKVLAESLDQVIMDKRKEKRLWRGLSPASRDSWVNMRRKEKGGRVKMSSILGEGGLKGSNSLNSWRMQGEM